MVKNEQFKRAAKRAVQNIVKHGDTDIFPFPFENHAFYNKPEELIELVVEYNNAFDAYLARFSPNNVSSLTPVTYSGFRWATQIDPIWNVEFLAMVLALGEQIEAARLPKARNIVFSYRYQPDDASGDLFDREFGWMQFMHHSSKLAESFEFVVTCDISEFYPRIGHHRLENALQQIAGDTPYPKRILDFLSNYSNTKSFGLPIGGPASRILSELTINQVDRLLVGGGVVFTRFADDYHLFANSREDAYRHLFFLSEKLFENQGLSLQKSKTRIMSSAEFIATNPLKTVEPDIASDDKGPGIATRHASGKLLQFSLRFDPYSPTAKDDFEHLRDEIKRFDILGLLKEELAKSRIHTALARKIVSAIRYLEGATKDDAVISIIDNCDLLYPIFSSVLLMIDQVFEELSVRARAVVIEKIQELIGRQSHIFRVDIHLIYAIRVLGHSNTPDNQAILQNCTMIGRRPLFAVT